MKAGKGFFFAFLLLASIVVGGWITDLVSRSTLTSWMAYTRTFNFSPSIDLVVVAVNLDFSVSISIAQVCAMGLCLWLFFRHT